MPPNALSLSVGDLGETLALTQLAWTSFSGTFIAAGATTALNFLFTTVAGSGTVFIDKIVVDRLLPLPSSLALVGLGLAGLAASRRRRH